MTETISGLLIQKADRTPPIQGAQRRFSWQDTTSKSGAVYTKVKNENEGYGQLCEVLSVRKTDYNRNGNVSFNVDFRVLPDQQTSLTPAGGTSPSQGISKNDYWERREQRDREWQAEQIRNKPRIERQHSQQMAIDYATLKGLKEITPAQMLELINWWQRDIDRSPEKTIPREPQELHEGEHDGVDMEEGF
jgi:hypothetical protein